jgi:hypothetical protein
MMRTSFLSFLGLSSVVFLAAGCGFSNDEASGSAFGSPGRGAPSPGADSPASGATIPSPPSQTSGGSGVLTAGDWDDNLNFSLFRDYIKDHDAASQTSAFESGDRIVITVTADDGAPVSNAQVLIAAPEKSYLSAPTATDGRVLFFPKHDGVSGDPAITVTVKPPAGQDAVQPVSVPLEKTATELTIKLPGAQKQLPSALDLAFVIDATGSMGDEIEYLKDEVSGIAEGVKAKFGNVSIQYSLIVYRDVGDDYVTRPFGFTPELGTFKGNLDKQSADGGGDFPEAMDQAMGLVPQLKWRAGNVARMAFLIADAPPHDEDIGATFKAMDALRPQGIKLYPVAASGVDPEAEYVMRVGAEATLGRYLFLTDDSGVGNSHAEPHIPCYQVQKLNLVIGRMIASELTGTRVPADPAEVLRAVGDPKDGVCKFQDGSEARL